MRRSTSVCRFSTMGKSRWRQVRRSPFRFQIFPAPLLDQHVRHGSTTGRNPTNSLHKLIIHELEDDLIFSPADRRARARMDIQCVSHLGRNDKLSLAAYRSYVLGHVLHNNK